MYGIREKLLEIGEQIAEAQLFLKSLTMEEIKDIAHEKFENLTDFILDMNFELAHDYIFMPPHYPLFFICQALFTCILIKKTQPKINWLRSFLVGYSICMLGRNIVGVISGMELPILQVPLYSFSYSLIWLLINMFPLDLFYLIMKSFVFYIPLQVMMALIAVRESTHGVDVGFRVFPASIAGAMGTSFVLCCTECLIWCHFFQPVREFSPFAILRNMLNAGIYILFTQYTELLNITITKEEVKIYAALTFIGLTLLDDILFGLSNRNGLGTFVTKLLSLIPYHGGDFMKNH